MGWFDEQIKTRIKMDEENFSDAFAELSSVVTGKTGPAFESERKRTQSAIGEILRYYNIKPVELPEQMEDMNDQLEFLLRPSGIMQRKVSLKGDWYRDAMGPYLGTAKDGSVVALIPKGLTYEFFHYGENRRIKVDRKTKSLVNEEALCFYKPLPLRELTIRDLIRFIAGSLSRGDYLAILFASLAATLLGLITPYAMRLIFGGIIPSGDRGLILPVAVLLLGAAVSATLINITKSLVINRVSSKMSMTSEAAAMARVLSLPASFFKDYGAGELAKRVESISDICGMLSESLFTAGISAIFSIIYLWQIFDLTPALALPAFLVMFAAFVSIAAGAFMQLKLNRKQFYVSSKVSGLVYAFFSGIQKIKLAGAEKRVFSKWAALYKKSAELMYDPPAALKLMQAVPGAAAMVGAALIYYIAAVSQVGASDFMAFNASYGLASGAVLSLSAAAVAFARIKPALEMAEPILKALPEAAGIKETVTRLSGNIELNNVSFRYGENGLDIISNLSLKIRAGQYVAVTGATGCGKSTLIKLLLGLLSPTKGAIYYDGRDMQKLDLKSLRRRIGSVMQNSSLFPGDILSNITITAPRLSLAEAWEAAETAGIAEDIRAMPMGMWTVISEGSGGVSGGQKQRLMIARAIAGKPSVLMFDEATSALDNITQKKISEALDGLKSTRIVIAHRLSTIRRCDRILVLQDGRITEDGTYDELIAKNGYFAGLVERQRLDDATYIGQTTLF